MSTITLQLRGLHCGHCVKSVENGLKALPTVTHVQVDLNSQTAIVESEESLQTLVETIYDLGFEAKGA
ncbi:MULTISPECIES: heavy-metal-associated domain-containing protein [Glaesserella]|uniref:HMA domain-containing protein n=1 Tax=Glaesserella australis TaxID=2094024 RepID=A0A328BYX4_9PAST|nr:MULTISPECIES: heavy metal-associated domain-containing protein [Glaesserella]AUI66267.1 hypothetical protein CJD39_06570 [Glaesserella sp. 15-184]RAL19289.1 hypothetical protein C5N92_03995 [Glaesserella australis]